MSPERTGLSRYASAVAQAILTGEAEGDPDLRHRRQDLQQPPINIPAFARGGVQ